MVLFENNLYKSHKFLSIEMLELLTTHEYDFYFKKTTAGYKAVACGISGDGQSVIEALDNLIINLKPSIQNRLKGANSNLKSAQKSVETLSNMDKVLNNI